MNCILGLLLKSKEKDYRFDKSMFTKHTENLRNYRTNLILTDKSLYHFEIFRFSDKSRQVHLLLEDGTIVVFNKKTKKIVTVILLTPKTLNLYIDKVHDVDQQTLRKLQKCSKLNEKFKVNENPLNEEQLIDYIQRKKKILS